MISTKNSEGVETITDISETYTDMYNFLIFIVILLGIISLFVSLYNIFIIKMIIIAQIISFNFQKYFKGKNDVSRMKKIGKKIYVYKKSLPSHKKDVKWCIILILILALSLQVNNYVVRYSDPITTQNSEIKWLIDYISQPRSDTGNTDNMYYSWCYRVDPNEYFYEERIAESLFVYIENDIQYTKETEQIESIYSDHVNNCNYAHIIDMGPTISYIEEAVEMGLLEEPSMELEDILENIKDPELSDEQKLYFYKMELLCRVRKYENYSSVDNALQIARSADDALEALKNTSNNDTIKQMILLSSIAIDFYCAVLATQENNGGKDICKNDYINNRIGVIFTALFQMAELIPDTYGALNTYKCHFWRCGEAFFIKSQELHYKYLLENPEYVSDYRTIDVEYYLAITQVKKIFHFLQLDKCQSCGEHAMNYLEYCKQNDCGNLNYINSCYDCMIKLMASYPDQLSDSLKARWETYVLSTNN